jgi:hypothetical protein
MKTLRMGVYSGYQQPLEIPMKYRSHGESESSFEFRWILAFPSRSKVSQVRML